MEQPVPIAWRGVRGEICVDERGFTEWRILEALGNGAAGVADGHGVHGVVEDVALFVEAAGVVALAFCKVPAAAHAPEVAALGRGVGIQVLLDGSPGWVVVVVDGVGAIGGGDAAREAVVGIGLDHRGRVLDLDEAVLGIPSEVELAVPVAGGDVGGLVADFVVGWLDDAGRVGDRGDLVGGVVGAGLQKAFVGIAVSLPVAGGIVAPIFSLLEVVDAGVGGGGADEVAEFAFLDLVESVIPVEVVMAGCLGAAEIVGEVVAPPLPVG